MARNYLKYCTITREDATQTQVFRCNVCDKTFKKKLLFRQHFVEVHLRIKKTTRCVLCHVQLISNMRSKHMNEVHGWRVPTCGACGRKFYHQHQLKTHQRIVHMGERNYKCDQCDKAFSTHQILKNHYAMHSDARPYTCEYCSKAFKIKETLRRHFKTHADEEKYICKVCGAKFVQSGGLNYHMKRQHPNADNDPSL